MYNEIKKIADSHVQLYMQRVSSSYAIPIKELETLWISIENTEDGPSVSAPVEPPSRPAGKPLIPVEKPKPALSALPPQAKTTQCPYVIKRGDQKGKICGVKANESGYCSKHKRYAPVTSQPDPDEVDDEQVLATLSHNSYDPLDHNHPLSTSEANANIEKNLEVSIEPPPKSKLSYLQVTRYVRHKELDRYWNPTTGFAIRSPTERLIVGKIVEDVLVPLDESDLQLCSKFNLEVIDDSDPTA